MILHLTRSSRLWTFHLLGFEVFQTRLQKSHFNRFYTDIYNKDAIFDRLKIIGSNLLYEFYKTPFCRTRFLEREECCKANKCDKMAYKTNVIQYFFYFAPILNFKLKIVQNTMLGKLYLAKIKGC
jgi:hypothetical protein